MTIFERTGRNTFVIPYKKTKRVFTAKGFAELQKEVKDLGFDL